MTKDQKQRTKSTWRNMKSRCRNPNATGYELYGGRGIAYAPHWHTFTGFLQDMGVRPEGRSLDRIDPDGNYTKENCRWATPVEQGADKSDSHMVTYQGRTQNVTAWARELGIKPNTLEYRLLRGWSVEEAFGEVCRVPLTFGKLSPEQRYEAIQRRLQGETTVALGQEFGIDSSAITRMVQRWQRDSAYRSALERAIRKKLKDLAKDAEK